MDLHQRSITVLNKDLTNGKPQTVLWQFREMKTAVSTSMITSGVICAVLMLIGGLFCGRLLQMIHTPDVLFADSALYLRIYIWGLPFVFFYNISNGIFSQALHGRHSYARA